MRQPFFSRTRTYVMWALLALTLTILWVKVPDGAFVPRPIGLVEIGRVRLLCRDLQEIIAIGYNPPGNTETVPLVLYFATDAHVEQKTPFAASEQINEKGEIRIYIDRNLDGRAEIVTTTDDPRVGTGPCDVRPNTH